MALGRTSCLVGHPSEPATAAAQASTSLAARDVACPAALQPGRAVASRAVRLALRPCGAGRAVASRTARPGAVPCPSCSVCRPGLNTAGMSPYCLVITPSGVTEPPFSSALNTEKREGAPRSYIITRCTACARHCAPLIVPRAVAVICALPAFAVDAACNHNRRSLQPCERQPATLCVCRRLRVLELQRQALRLYG